MKMIKERAWFDSAIGKNDESSFFWADGIKGQGDWLGVGIRAECSFCLKRKFLQEKL